MGSIYATWLKEAKSCRDSKPSQYWEALDVLDILVYFICLCQSQKHLERTADLVAPPLAPGLAVAPLNENTVDFLNASPVSRTLLEQEASESA